AGAPGDRVGAASPLHYLDVGQHVVVLDGLAVAGVAVERDGDGIRAIRVIGRVAPVAAAEGVGAGTSPEDVVAGAARDRVVAVAPREDARRRRIQRDRVVLSHGLDV